MVGQEKWTEGMDGKMGQEKESDTESMEAVRDNRSSPSFNEERETPKKRWRVGSAVGRSR